MKLETLGLGGLDYAPCQYGLSRLFFRGPRKALEGDYVACVGSTETFGRFVQSPFPDLLQGQIGRECVNFGCMNAGMDAFLRDSAVMAACHDATDVVIQIMGAQNQSNRFYTVHPRRNDRFLRPTVALTTLFPDVDFADFTFTRHMLGMLHLTSKDRFALVRQELQSQWLCSMRQFLSELGGSVVLLWLADHTPSNAEDDHILRSDPLFVTQQMLDTLAGEVSEIVVIVPSRTELEEGATGMVYGVAEAHAAAQMLGSKAHERAADELSVAIGQLH